MLSKWKNNRRQKANGIRHTRAAVAQFQTLEGRTLMSAVHAPVHAPVHMAVRATLPPAIVQVPLSVSSFATSSGNELQITGTAGGDVINLKQTPTALLLTTGTGWSDALLGSYSEVIINAEGGNNTITIDKSVADNLVLYGGGNGTDIINDGGSGADNIYGGAGTNTITCGSGNDTVVTIGDTKATIHGGSGLDSFWVNSTGDTLAGVSATETKEGCVHEVASFMPLRVEQNGVWTTTAVSKALTGQTFPEPTLTGYATGYSSFASNPLFASTGPGDNDIEQGDVGDCYFLATLSAVAKTNPQLIRQSIVSLGDGTYAVQMFNASGVKTYLRIDAELPITSWGALAFDGAGTGNDIWAALLEKAYAYYRSDAGSYASINAGYMSDAFTAMGLKNESIYSASSATSLLQQLQSLLNAGDAVTYATASDMGNLIGGHAYTVEGVTTDAQGNITGLELRNPWGITGAGTNPNGSPYVTVTAAEAYEDFSFATYGTRD
jgi:hypothetical protein